MKSIKDNFQKGDRVMLGALHDKLIEDDKLASSARTSDPRIFTESIFPISVLEMQQWKAIWRPRTVMDHCLRTKASTML